MSAHIDAALPLDELIQRLEDALLHGPVAHEADQRARRPFIALSRAPARNSLPVVWRAPSIRLMAKRGSWGISDRRTKCGVPLVR